MPENINEKLSKILSGLGQNGQSIKNFLSTDEGKKLKNSLSDKDKRAIMDKFMSMNANEVKAKLKSADLSNLGNVNFQEIMKKLK